MAVFAYTQTERVLGKLTNGRKLVLTEITITDSNTSATTITIKSLRKLIGWTLGLGTPGADTFVCADGSADNTISITPSADATNDVLQILAVGL